MKCSCCKVEKSDKLFYKHPSIKPDGIRKKCNDCRKLYRKNAHNNNPEIAKNQAKSWAAKNKNKLAEMARAYRKKDPKRFKGYSLKKSFGIGIEEYNNLLLEQNNVCAICNQPETAILNGKLKELAVDHCHITGKIRGLLCTKCNPGLGYFQDSEERLSAAIAYLKRVS